MVVAFGVMALILAAAGAVLRQEVGVELQILHWQAVLLWAPLGMILLSALAGVIPAVKAYRTDVAANL